MFRVAKYFTLYTTLCSEQPRHPCTMTRLTNFHSNSSPCQQRLCIPHQLSWSRPQAPSPSSHPATARAPADSSTAPRKHHRQIQNSGLIIARSCSLLYLAPSLSCPSFGGLQDSYLVQFRREYGDSRLGHGDLMQRQYVLDYARALGDAALLLAHHTAISFLHSCTFTLT